MNLLVLVCVLFSLLPLAVLLPQDSEWEEWKAEHGKQYRDNTEENYRYSIWKQNLYMIKSHNMLADEGKETYWLGMNHLGDMTREEIIHTLNGFVMNERDTNTTIDVFKPSRDFVPKKKVDWRAKGAVTPIKNQKQCGSCWAFSATGSLEGQHFLKKGKLVSLSEQNLIDCSSKEGNNGCSGGLMDDAFKYVIKNQGIDTEKSYPYQGKDGKCRFNKGDIGATEKSFKDIKKGSVDGVVEACTKIGPISVAMDASTSKFHFYKKGVFKDKTCSSQFLDHGVLVVGYGTEEGVDYFLVKNSWGKKWGMDGYFMISRKNNMCGIATKASYPIV